MLKLLGTGLFPSFTAALPALQRALPALQLTQCSSFATRASPSVQDGKSSKSKDATTKGKKKAKKASGDLASTRIPSAYTLFIKDPAARPAGAQAAKSGSSLIKQLAAQWKAMTDAQKQPYVEQAQQMKAEILQAREAQKSEKKAVPPSAYTAFVKEQMPSFANSGLKAPEIIKQVAQQWKALPEAERQQRQEAAKQAKEAWQQKNTGASPAASSS